MPACGQMAAPAGFKLLLARLNQNQYDRRGNRLPAMPLPVVYRDSTYAGNGAGRELKFELRLAAHPLNLTHRVVQLRGQGYPVAYSVLFQNCLVALFKNGRFSCYQLPDLTPNEQLAGQLNVGAWKQCWLIDGSLVAQNSKGYYAFEAATHAWQPYTRPVPFGQQPKLYEDAHYLVYASCHGEFGGTAYFYNKQTGKTHHMGATCANSVWQENDRYCLLASLGHMMGSAEAVTITNPELLPLVAAGQRRQYDTTALSRRGVTSLFGFYGLQLFGGLRWQGRMHYLVNWHSTTFLATIEGKQIAITDPLFANDLYTHNPVTTAYGPDLALTNLDFYGLGGSDEVAALLWQGQQVTKVEWGKQSEEIR